MKLTRRETLAGAAAASLVAALPKPAIAGISLGNGSLITLSDGNLVLPGNFIFETMPPEQLAELLAEFDLSKERIEPDCNLALYRNGDLTVLFDVGSGPDFMPSAGKIADSLDAIGLAPEDITHVLFTHAHWDYWWNPNTVSEIGEARAAFAVGAKRRMEMIEDSVELFDPGQEVLPGIAAIASYGHTPGHMAFELRAGSDAALVVGDAIGNHHVAFAKPDWESGSDQDAALAVKTRAMLLDRLVTEKMQLIGFHLPDGGIGRAERKGDAFQFVGANT